MIISASRRTDLPTYYGEWFMNRLRDGFFMTRNPISGKVTKSVFEKEDIDCICFWTKNPIPFFRFLPELNSMNIPYYFQFTVTGYGRDMEANIPDTDRMIKAFRDLYAEGNKNVIWRYDPIIFTDEYTPEWHLNAFRHIAESLKGYTKRCVISFVDIYTQVADRINITSPLNQRHRINLTSFCKKLADIARENGMQVFTCAEQLDFDKAGVLHGSCIDADYISEITGLEFFHLKKDVSQRASCGCIESLDIGAYSTCKNGCKYCYANKDDELVETCMNRYDANSPLLCDTLNGKPDYEKRLAAVGREPQLTLF